MKPILLSVIMLLFATLSQAQLKLDVAGDARVKGRLDIQSDGTLNLFIGPSSGLNNTDGNPYNQRSAFVHLPGFREGGGQPAGQSPKLSGRYLPLFADPGRDKCINPPHGGR